ncbi:MAG TPA: hypothetical protein DHV29_01740 [Bacteroidales bacterium]|nr:hypothetical protein [Bacteroidales bacterium]HCY22190.1 hypothetical protein [Bacteroidales bacterium]
MKKLLLFCMALWTFGMSYGQLSGIKAIPGDYATITAAVTDLNTVGVGPGGVTFNVAAGYTESTTAEIVVTATGTATDPIIFQKDPAGVGANPLITRTDAGVNTTSTAGGLGDAVITISAGDYITFDGIDVTAPVSTIEYGYFTTKTATDACKFLTIKNSNITMFKGTSGYVFGIYISNGTTSVSSSTGVTVTALSGATENTTIIGNTISNVHAGIYARGAAAAGFGDNNLAIGQTGAGNTIVNYGGGSATSTWGIYMIYQTNISIQYNTINNAGGGGTDHASTLYGVFHSVKSGSGIVSYIGNNFTLGESGTSAAHGIYDGQTVASKTFLNNTFTYGTFASTTASYAIYNSSATNDILVEGNSISAPINKTGVGAFYFYSNTGTPTGGTETCVNNNFSNVTVTGSSALYGLYSNTATAQDRIAYGNMVSNLNVGTGACYPLYFLSSNNNLIHHNSVTTITSGGTIYGLYFTGTAPVVYNNTISACATSGATFYGIYNAGTGTTSCYSNKVTGLASTNAAPSVYGFYITAGTSNNNYNNFVSELYAPSASAANAVVGMYVSGGTAINLYYNTIYLNAASSGVDFGTSGIYASSTPTVELKNNIIVNNSTASGTGLVAAYRRSSATLTTYAATSNNNDWYAGTPSATNVIYYDGTNTDQDLAAFQTRVTPADGGSFTEMPPFVNIAATPYDLHLQTTINTGCESGGMQITTPAITTDFDNDVRFGETGYTGTGAATDVGADEFNGQAAFTCALPVPGNTTTTANGICFGEQVVLSTANATPGTGVSYQWQSSTDGITFTDVTGETNSTYTIIPTASLYYQCVVTCQNGPSTGTSTPLQITFANSITGTTPATRCGTGTVDLAATGTGTSIVWFDAAIAGSIIGTGSPFTTPVLSATTPFYVAAMTSSPGTIKFGTGTSASSTYSPFNGGYGGTKYQMIFTANELVAAGIAPGNITSLTLHMSTAASTYPDFYIDLGNTALTEFATPVSLAAGLTQVYYTANMAPVVGDNLITLDTPYNWDGTSNIIVSICWSNGTTTSTGSSSYYNSKSTYASQYMEIDSQTGTYVHDFVGGTLGSGSFVRHQYRPHVSFAANTACYSPATEVIATVAAAPAFSISSDTVVCNNSAATLSVTSTLANYDSYTWTPATGLFTDAAGTVPYVGGSSSNIVYAKTTTAGNSEYICSAFNSGTGCADIDTVNVLVLPSAPVATASPEAICVSGSSVISVSPNTGYGTATFQWMSSTDNVTFGDIVAANAISYTTAVITDTMYYKMVVELGATVCTETNVVTINVNNPSLLTFAHDTICGEGSAMLTATATAGADALWFEDATGAVYLATGNTFATPVISATTTYYTGAGIDYIGGSLGAPNTGVSASVSSQTTTTAGINFDVTAATATIHSVDIYPTSVVGSAFTITVSQGGSPVATYSGTTTVSGTTGAPVVMTVPVNFNLPIGTGYKMVMSTNPGTIRNSGGDAFPYTIANLITMTSSTLGGYYYYLYNWKVSTGCMSALTPVTAMVNTPPAITLTASATTICQNDDVTLGVTSSNDPNYSYSWTPGAATGSTLVGSPMISTTYVVTAEDNTGGLYDGCVISDSVSITVNPSPILVTASASDSSICAGLPVDLYSSADANVPSTATIFSESFENGGAIPIGWTSELDVDGNATSATFYYVTTSSYPNSFTAYDGTYFVRFNSFSVSNGNSARLISAPVSTVGKTGLDLSFAWTVDDGYSAATDSLAVQYSTDGTTWSTFMEVLRYDTLDTWTLQNAALPVGAENQATLYIGFLFTSDYGNDCHIDDVNLTETLDASVAYSWTSSPAGFTSNLQNAPGVVPAATTTYTVAAENFFNCVTTDDVTVTVNPIPVVDLGTDQTFCDTTTITLNAGNPGSTYVWSTGGNSQTEIILGSDLGAGTHTVTVDVTSAAGCTGSDAVGITVTVCDGIDDPSMHISFYPNPATGMLNLDLSELPTGDYRFELLNMQGQKVMDKILVNDGTVISVNLMDVAAGSYVISVTGNDNSFRNYLNIQE